MMATTSAMDRAAWAFWSAAAGKDKVVRWLAPGRVFGAERLAEVTIFASRMTLAAAPERSSRFRVYNHRSARSQSGGDFLGASRWAGGDGRDPRLFGGLDKGAVR